MSKILFAQSVNVPLRHWAYDFLERLEIKGSFNSLLLRTRPITRRDLATLLKQIEKNYREQKIKLNRAELNLFAQLKGEFFEELNLLSVKSERRYYERHLLKWDEEGNKFKIDLDFAQQFNIYRGDQYDRTKRASQTTLGGIVSGNLKNGLAFNVRFKNTLVKGEDIIKENFNPQSGKPITIAGQNVFSDDASAYIIFSLPYFQIEFGRDNAKWGNGIRSKLMLADNRYYFDLLKFRMRFRHFLFISIHGKLTSSAGARFLAAHRLDVKLFPWLMLAGSESVIYGNRNIEPSYLNPFMPYHVAEHHLGDKDNNTIGMDITTFPFKNHKLYFELFLDDFTSAENPFTYFGNKFAFTTGWHWVDPFGLKSVDLQIEYSRVEPFVYTHRDSINVYKNYDRPIGHWLGPNADDLYIKSSYLPNRDLKIALLVERTRHGEGSIDIPHDISSGTRKKFLSGIVETTWSCGFEIRDQIFRDCFLVLNYYYLHTNNLNRIISNNSKDNQVNFSLMLNY